MNHSIFVLLLCDALVKSGGGRRMATAIFAQLLAASSSVYGLN